MILITGTPRSGTQYVSYVLNRLGFDVPHEKLGKDGTVSSVYIVNDPAGEYLGGHEGDPPALDVAWSNVVHLVRDPYMAIPSIQYELSPNFWSWQERHTGLSIRGSDPFECPTLEGAARFWLAWTELVEQRAPDTMIRAEDFRMPATEKDFGRGKNVLRRPGWNPGRISEVTLDAVKERRRAFGYGGD